MTLFSEIHFAIIISAYLNIYYIKLTTQNGAVCGGSCLIIQNIYNPCVMMEDQQRLISISVYCSPRRVIHISEDQHTAYVNSLGNRFVVGGDFNARHQRWASQFVTPRGWALLDAWIKITFPLANQLTDHLIIKFKIQLISELWKEFHYKVHLRYQRRHVIVSNIRSSNLR